MPTVQVMPGLLPHPHHTHPGPRGRMRRRREDLERAAADRRGCGPSYRSIVSRVMRLASRIGTVVMAMTNKATTLVTGRWRGLVSWLNIQIGSVSCCPAVKVVTMISSKDRAKASTAPATLAVAKRGRPSGGAAAAARDPNTTAIRVATSATLTERNRAAQTSLRPQATANHAVVKPGRGKRKGESAGGKAYRTTTAKGRCRKRRGPTAASSTARGAGRPLERIEGPQPLGSQQVDRHHGHRHDGEGGRQRDGPGGAVERQGGPTEAEG